MNAWLIEHVNELELEVKRMWAVKCGKIDIAYGKNVMKPKAIQTTFSDPAIPAQT